MADGEEIRLAWIIGRLNVGGPAVLLLAAASALARRGYRSTILAGTPGPDEGDLSEEARSRGLALWSVPEMARAVRPDRDLRALWRLAALLRRLRPHVVQTQTAKAGALGRVAARWARIPAVHTFHGHVFEGYFPPLASLAITFAERVLARVGDAVVALSPSQAEELAERWHIGRAPLPVVPMGIELGPLLSADAERGALRRELAVPGGVPVIAFVGRLIAIKGLSTLLQSLAGLRREGIAFRLVVAGDGDRRASLEREARGAGLGSWAHFLGWRRDLPRLYADADVVALPSRREGVPVSVMEAMAAGRPVVAAHVGGVPDLVEDGRTGCLVPPGDPIALARAVRDLLADPARRRAMGDAARATARERFDVERSAGALDAFYRGLLARPRRLRQ